MNTIVDIHCHIFNADDLPVRGFVKHTSAIGEIPVAGSLVAALLDHVVQGDAPGYDVEMPLIRRLLAPPNDHLRLAVDAAVDGDQLRDLAAPRARVTPTEALENLRTEDPELYERLRRAVPEDTTDGIHDLTADPAAIKRFLAWAQLYGSARLTLAGELMSNFGDEVDLFCPMLVDLGTDLGDQAVTTMAQQVELLEGISILSMRHDLPVPGKAKLHPFVGFDPKAQARAVIARSPVEPFDVIEDAVMNRGFVGVKLYPPMGWRPIGNAGVVDEIPHMTRAEAVVVDSELRKFYAWCVREDVPLTAHVNHSNSADDAFADFTGPTSWAAVLKEFRGLRLNFGHFGGLPGGKDDVDWRTELCRLVVEHDHVYADTGNHPIHEKDRRGRRTRLASYLELLTSLFDAPATAKLQDRLMFGSDWFMLATYPDHDKFLETYRDAFATAFPGSTRTEKFLGQNALSFLGFPESRNADRLREFYSTHAEVHPLPEWLQVP